MSVQRMTRLLFVFMMPHSVAFLLYTVKWVDRSCPRGGGLDLYRLRVRLGRSVPRCTRDRFRFSPFLKNGSGARRGAAMRAKHAPRPSTSATTLRYGGARPGPPGRSKRLGLPLLSSTFGSCSPGRRAKRKCFVPLDRMDPR